MPEWLLNAIEGAVAAIPSIGGLLAPIVAAIPVALQGVQSLLRMASSIPINIGAINLNSITRDIAAIPVIGGLLASVIELAPTALRYLQSLLGAIGLDTLAGVLDELGAINTNAILSQLGNVFQGVLSGAPGAASSATGLIQRSMGGINRIIRDLSLSWQWFMNPENPRGYQEIMRRLNLFTAPRTQPHLRANQPPRVGFLYYFSDPYILSHDLVPSYNVAGGRL